MMREFIADTTNVKQLGRTYLDDDNILWCGFSATGVEFTANASKIEISVVGDDAAVIPYNNTNYARIAIFVDGERVVDDMLNVAARTYAFEGEKGNHTIALLKLSETAMSCVGIKAIITDGEIKPTPQKNRFIEIIGDSITCGYGVDDEVAEHEFSTATEDVTKSYSYRTVTVLDSDYSMVSISGYGIISGYTGDGTKISEQTIPQYYDKLGFTYGGFGKVKPQDIEWDFAHRQPDVIVINLGTNDDSYCLDDNARQQEFVDNYCEFLKVVRKHNPAAKILCTLGIMGDRLFPVVEKSVERYSQESGDNNIDTMHFAPQLEEDGFVAAWHPTVRTHKKVTERLVAKIKEIME